MIGAGLALLVLGGDLPVRGAVGAASALGVCDALIGLTVAAVGASPPERTTSVVAALRGRSDVVFGTVAGSNIHNILGVTALVEPMAAPAQIAALDGWVMLAATVALVAAMVTGWRVNRTGGAALLAGYAAYLDGRVAAA